MGAWDKVFELVASGKIDPKDGANLAANVLADLEQIGGGKDLTQQQLLALASTALPVVELVAGVLFPGADKAVAAAAVILSLSHKMTPDEERAWMDRASAASSI